jgi:hypothetical protein
MMFSELVKQAHATALEKGWHEGEDRSLNRAGALIALMHSEVVEAADAFWEPALVEEQADVLIRLADAVGWFGWEVDDFNIAAGACIHEQPGSSVAVHRMLVKFGTEHLRISGKPHPALAKYVASACEAWRRSGPSGSRGVSLMDAIKAKLEKNKTRSFRHGGKLL